MTFVLAPIVASALVAAAPSGDYGLDADSWNGIGYLMTTAEEAHVDLEVAASVDLTTLEPGEALVVLYPLTALPADDLLGFVDSGGLLVVADDRGGAGALFAGAGLTRDTAGPTAHKEHYQDLPAFPIVRPQGRHFLFFNVDQVVTNHPAVLREAGPSSAGGGPGVVWPILSFDGGREHLIAEVPIGSGKLLAIADPSIFLNEMERRFYGNKQLAANVMRYYCTHEPCKARLVLPGTPFTGHYDARNHRLGTLPKDLAEAVSALDDALADVSETLALPPWAWLVLGVFALAALVLGLRAVARLRRPVAVAIPTDAARRAAPPAHEEARGLVQQRAEADFLAMALTLGEHGVDLADGYDLERIARPPGAFGDAATSSPGAPPTGTEPHPLEPREREQLRDALLRVRAEVASLHARQPPVVPADRFLRLHGDVEVLARFARGRRRVHHTARPRATGGVTSDGDFHGAIR